MGSVARRRGRGALAPRGLSRVSTAVHASINGPQLALHNTLANIPLISICQFTVCDNSFLLFTSAKDNNRICLGDKYMLHDITAQFSTRTSQLNNIDFGDEYHKFGAFFSLNFI